MSFAPPEVENEKKRKQIHTQNKQLYNIITIETQCRQHIDGRPLDRSIFDSTIHVNKLVSQPNKNTTSLSKCVFLIFIANDRSIAVVDIDFVVIVCVGVSVESHDTKCEHSYQCCFWIAKGFPKNKENYTYNRNLWTKSKQKCEKS